VKVLLLEDTPAYLCHGGKQVLAQKLYGSLRNLGIDVEYARSGTRTRIATSSTASGVRRSWSAWHIKRA